MNPVRAGFAVLLLSGLTACAGQSPEQVSTSLKQATLSAVAGLDADKIEVLTSTHTTSKWTWKVRAGAKIYACDADNQLRLPDCKLST